MNAPTSLFDRLRARMVHRRRSVALVAGIAPHLVPHARVLDVGTGNGYIAGALAQRDPTLHMEGVDVVARPHTHIPVQLFDGTRLPYEDNSRDAVMLIDVLHHARNPALLLQESARVARTIIIKDHLCHGKLSHAVLSFMDYIGNRGTGIPQPYRYFSRLEWDAMFAAQRLEVTAWQEKLGLYPPPASWIFERSLHFIAVLRKSSAA